MFDLNRRQLLGGAVCAAAVLLGRRAAFAAPKSDAAAPEKTRAEQPGLPAPPQAANPAPSPLPRTVAGVRLPDTPLARSSVALATAAYPPYLLNHALRTYVFGALSGRANQLSFDLETLFLGCLLHDLGLTPKFEGDLPFEIQGAQGARKFLIEQGMPAVKADMVWDGIAMHPLWIGSFKRPEISLVGAGAGADVIGPDPKEIPAAKVAETLSAFPRLRFKDQFLKTCTDVLTRHPRGAGQTFMRDIAERYVPNFHHPNFCERMAEAPFSE